jgi:hypothetical protein
MIIQGYANYDYPSNATYFYNAETNTLVPGPPLAVPRAQFQCSRAIGVSNSPAVVVSGGYSSSGPLNSTEILYLDSGVWTSGPDLPKPIWDGVMLEHPAGGVVILGGNSVVGASAGQTSIYYLIMGSGWVKLPQELKYPRSRQAAFYVPDSLTACA